MSKENPQKLFSFLIWIGCDAFGFFVDAFLHRTRYVVSAQRCCVRDTPGKKFESHHRAERENA
jgi:hypothetical protein